MQVKSEERQREEEKLPTAALRLKNTYLSQWLIILIMHIERLKHSTKCSVYFPEENPAFFIHCWLILPFNTI